MRLVIVDGDIVLLDASGDIAKDWRLCYLFVPDQVPLGKSLRYVVTIVEANPILQASYSPVILSIRHGSTK